MLQLRLLKKEIAVFEFEPYANICLVVMNGGKMECPADAVFYYNVRTDGGTAGKGLKLCLWL